MGDPALSRGGELSEKQSASSPDATHPLVNRAPAPHGGPNPLPRARRYGLAPPGGRPFPKGGNCWFSDRPDQSYFHPAWAPPAPPRPPVSAPICSSWPSPMEPYPNAPDPESNRVRKTTADWIAANLVSSRGDHDWLTWYLRRCAAAGASQDAFPLLDT